MNSVNYIMCCVLLLNVLMTIQEEQLQSNEALVADLTFQQTKVTVVPGYEYCLHIHVMYIHV